MVATIASTANLGLTFIASASRQASTDSTQRSKSYLAAEAIREFVEHNEWQIAQTRAALREADAGDFATDEDVAALARKWQVSGTGNAP